jgi:hypothetical protein
MRINLIGKLSNAWGAEHHVLSAMQQLGHDVTPIELSSAGLVRELEQGAFTVVMQGYGLPARLVDLGRRITGMPWVLWHAEVMSPRWPTDDHVAMGKAAELAQIAYAFDAVAHNCDCCLETVKKVRGERGMGKPVFWAPANGVPEDCRPDPDVQKDIIVGMYGHPSRRRMEIVTWLRSQGMTVDWAMPADGYWGPSLAQFIRRCVCVLNLHYSQSPNTECRIYEAIGCGVIVVSEPLSMPQLFPPNRYPILTSPNKEGLLDHLRFVHGVNADDLAKLGRQTSEYLHADASYERRCEFFLEEAGKRVPCA